jgi:AraC-like DNA-binding protein
VGKILSLVVLKEAVGETGGAIAKILEYVNEHYKEPITRRALARAVGYHESYVSHSFLENLNISLTDYILSLRIGDARALLRSTDQSISSIALSLGFGSIRSFNRAFLKFVHTTPREYRKKK